MESREIKGFAIIAKGDLPVAVSEEEFLVPSQSGNGKYAVKHLDGWQCDCLDFKTRGIECKHIHATKFLLKMRNKIEADDLNVEEELNKQECPHCHSNKIIKNGSRKTASGIRQRFQCSVCNKRFVLEPIKGRKANAKIITLTMDLYYKGLSLRDISDTVFQFYNIRIHFDTIRRWINNFSNVAEEYANQFKPKTSGTINTDEQMIKSKGNWIWAWNSIDPETRFLLASTISKGKKISDARKHFREVKAQADKEPEKIITDSLGVYHKAINKEFKTMRKKTRHVSIVKRRHEIDNNMIERYHNDFREFDKTRRGFKSDKCTQKWANGFRLYHNFIHENSSIGTTPAQRAGINLNLGRNKWMGLIEKANDHPNTTKEGEK